MDNIRFPILGMTALLILLAFLSWFETAWTTQLVLVATAISPLLVIWMVVRVLRDGKPSDHTFEDRFYEDLP